MWSITQGCVSCWFALVISSRDNCSWCHYQSCCFLSLLIWLSDRNSRSLLIIDPFLRLANPTHGFSINFSAIVLRFCWRRKYSWSWVTLNLSLRSFILFFVGIVVFLTMSLDCFRIFWFMTFVHGVNLLSTIPAYWFTVGWIKIQKHRSFGFLSNSLPLIGCIQFQMSLFFKFQLNYQKQCNEWKGFMAMCCSNLETCTSLVPFVTCCYLIFRKIH